MTRKLIIHDGHTQRELLLVGTITVGRDPSCHITDLDPLLSRRHAEFVTTAESVTVRDLGSRNGMLVNGEKVRDHVLVPGDLVQLGHLELRYVERHTVYTPEAQIVSYATTASGMGGAIRAAAAAAAAKAAKPGDALEDTQPHPPHEQAAPGHDADVTRAPDRREPDATFMVGASDADATVAPSRNTGADLDANFIPGINSAIAAMDAQIVADRDLRVVAASDSCRDVFGAAPDALVGQPLGDLLARSLQRVAAGSGPAALSFVVVRSPSDRTLTLTIKAVQPVETAT